MSAFDEKENSKSEESEVHTAHESRAIECINSNLVVIINLTNLHTYYQWVSLFPNLEKLCSTRFINESTKPKELVGQLENSELVNQKEVIKACNFAEKFTKDYIYTHFKSSVIEEEEHTDTTVGDEKVIFTVKEDPCLNVKPSHRLGTSVSTKLTSDKMQIFKDPECFNDYPHTKIISEEFFSETRFKNFLKTFNELYKKIKERLLRTRKFNQQITQVYHSRGLIKDSYNVSSKTRQELATMASLTDRIDHLHAKIKEKEALIKLKEKVIKECSENKKLLNSEIQMSIDERMEKLSQILNSIENKLSKRDLSLIPDSLESCSESE